MNFKISGFFLCCLILAAALSGCHGKGGQSALDDLEAWDRQREYDPVTNRWYHTGTPGRDMTIGGYEAVKHD